MNYPGHAAAGPWCYPDDAGEAVVAAAAARNTTTSFTDMIADHYFTDDLFQLAWSGSGAPVPMQPAAVAAARSPPPEVRFEPPSEGEMAAWLCAIVRGDGGCRDVPAAEKKPSDDTSTTSSTDEKEKLPLTEGMGSTEQEMRKPPAGESARRSHNGEAHKITEKRRRDKINERLRTLQQLVPGCDDKCNQTATLDQTIQYVKSLQHHVQATMSDGGPPARRPPPLLAYHVMPPPQYVVLGPAPATTTMVPAMLQLPGYPAAMPVMMPAGTAPLYPATAPPRAPGGAGSSSASASHRQGSSSSKRKGSSRSLRPRNTERT